MDLEQCNESSLFFSDKNVWRVEEEATVCLNVIVHFLVVFCRDLLELGWGLGLANIISCHCGRFVSPLLKKYVA
jgi:hypothetical protein